MQLDRKYRRHVIDPTDGFAVNQQSVLHCDYIVKNDEIDIVHVI